MASRSLSCRGLRQMQPREIASFPARLSLSGRSKNSPSFAKLFSVGAANLSHTGRSNRRAAMPEPPAGLHFLFVWRSRRTQPVSWVRFSHIPIFVTISDNFG